jgi:hypothetical protein
MRLEDQEIPTCLGCGKPVVPGEGRWAGDPRGEWHYSCAEQANRVVRQTSWPVKEAYAALLLSSDRSNVGSVLQWPSASRAAARSNASLNNVRGARMRVGAKRA